MMTDQKARHWRSLSSVYRRCENFPGSRPSVEKEAAAGASSRVQATLAGCVKSSGMMKRSRWGGRAPRPMRLRANSYERR